MRLIDANEAKKQVRKMQVLKASEKNLLALALDRTPTYEPSNAPLTLEELREMDGEPVWVTTKFDVAIAVEEWALVSTELRGVLGLKNRLFFEDYGDAGWLAYRWKQ